MVEALHWAGVDQGTVNGGMSQTQMLVLKEEYSHCNYRHYTKYSHKVVATYVSYVQPQQVMSMW